MIRISSSNFRRSKIYRFEIHPEKARFHQRSELTNCIWTRAFERRENVCKQGKETWWCPLRIAHRSVALFHFVYSPVSLRAKYPRDISYFRAWRNTTIVHTQSHRIENLLEFIMRDRIRIFFLFLFSPSSFFSSFSSLPSPTSIYFVWTFRVSNKFARI